jgi:NAD(P)-dependent dehydrogenase (short-subunit alcohol dehydrogenase family)
VSARTGERPPAFLRGRRAERQRLAEERRLRVLFVAAVLALGSGSALLAYAAAKAVLGLPR